MYKKEVLFSNIFFRLCNPFVFLSVRYMDPEAYHRESYGNCVDVFLFALIVHEVSCIHFLLKRCIV
ncbi:putative protein kinase-like domain superfamily [Helianthus anomalus]